jgi:hypothetical protein
VGVLTGLGSHRVAAIACFTSCAFVAALVGAPPGRAALRSGARTAAATSGTEMVQIVFDGSGSATDTRSSSAGGSTTDTDTFSWHAVYVIPLSTLTESSSQPGWNTTNVQEDYSRSTFTGTSSASCTPPSGGSCVEPGGGTSCQGSFTNNNSVPLNLLVFSPPSNGVYKVAAPAFSAAQQSSNCYPAALTDTCDPLYSQGQNGPVTGQVNVDSNNPGTSAPASVSEQQPWSCSSSDGGSTDSGSIAWNGTITVSALLPPEKAAAKEAARQDLSNIYFRDAAFCFPEADIRFLSQNLADLAGQPAWLRDFCLRALDRAYRDILIVDDPPRADYLQVATVPAGRGQPARGRPCSRVNTGRRAFCLLLSSAFAHQLAAQGRLTAVVTAIATTVARESSAQQAGDQAAVTLQEHALAGLEKQFRQAKRAAGKAGAMLAKLLRRGGVSGRVPEPLYKKALAAMRKRLAAKGVSNSELARILGGKKPPKTPPNLLNALARG